MIQTKKSGTAKLELFHILWSHVQTKTGFFSLSVWPQPSEFIGIKITCHRKAEKVANTAVLTA